MVCWFLCWLSSLTYTFVFLSLSCSHCILNALTHKWPTPAYDDSLVNRPSDPGTGAFSYSMGREFIASKELKAGDEGMIPSINGSFMQVRIS